MATIEPILTRTKETNKLFPIFLRLENMKLLIIGGDHSGCEKLNIVLQNAPATEITLIATAINKEIQELADIYPNITLLERAYDKGVLEEGEIIIVAVKDHSLSKKIYLEAKERGKLVNVADTPELSDFCLGSIVQKGNLK